MSAFFTIQTTYLCLKCEHTYLAYPTNPLCPFCHYTDKISRLESIGNADDLNTESSKVIE